jgi:uncharacterized membrane protein
VWIFIVAAVAIAAGFDKVCVTGTSLVLVCAALAVVGAQYHMWMAYGCSAVGIAVAASTLFYALHCKPLAAARRAHAKEQK